jgi:hypothetical protein
VSENLTCFACEREPTQQCPRCGRPYCDEHGDELCDVCLSPASGVPSFSLYRGSLLALLVGTALAVWLLVQPASSQDDQGSRPVVLTPTAVARATTPGPGLAGTPGASGTGTPRAGGTTTPGTPQATPGAGGTYTVAAGDTLSSICATRRPASMTLADCVAWMVSNNNLGSDTAPITVGQTLRTPA